MKQLSPVAQCAKLIRAELKQNFPNIKFSVRSSNFSMGNAIDIRYSGNVAEEDVEKLVAKYEYGRYDGMQDMYEINNRRNDIPQAKYICVYQN